MKSCIRAFSTVALTSLLLAGCAGKDEPENPGTPPRVRVITTQQYLNTVANVFGSSVSMDMKFPPLRRTDGLLANGAALAGVTAGKIETFQRAASSIAAQVVAPERRNYLIPCTPADEKKADAECAKQFFSQTGRLLHRRKLSEEELGKYVTAANTAADKLNDFYAGVELTLEAMLISPEVLFIVETSDEKADKHGSRRLDAYSLASRLSFFLWDAGPDDMVLTAAENGDLDSDRGLKKVVDQMLASPRLEDGMRAFFDDMLGFDDFDALSKDPTVYPFFTGATAADAREQTMRTIVDHLIHKQEDYRELYTTRETFMSPALAPLYQIPASRGWTEYTFPEDSPRQGLLTQVSFVALRAHPGRSSPTLRGRALRERLLCQVVPPPPPNVDFGKLENPDAHYKTQRERVAVHLEDPACAGCHKITDPMGLALESFDGAGRFRTQENGATIDTSGELDGVHFADVVGLGKALHDNPALPSCLVDRLYSYGSGGAAKPSDRPLLKFYTAEFEKAGYKLPEVLRTITLSDAFQTVTEAKKVNATESREPTEEILIEEHLPTTTTVDTAAPANETQTVAMTSSHDKN
ncbi:DUF1592 domain-containing protein [Steroidobacter agaridevorans]|uniref:DUF1592 domain-containing protein n=1 Tax=Steroidobacter agaridevorans TaxID=2695856 RepID=UPI00132C1B1B|nr:DUF1592 domain-containing protein [Steroidobacter agaridevorans]GFE86496.1 hypothetical protein GCM10011488_14500 [Steroidobacter agaridevorans]